MSACRACLLLAACLALAAGPLPPKSAPPATGKRTSKGRTSLVTALQFSADGKRIAAAGLDGKIALRDAPAGKSVVPLAGHPGGAYALSFAPDGKTLFSAGADGKVRAWDAATGEQVRAFEGHKGAVAAVAVSADGKRLASGGYDGAIILWNPATGKEIRRLEGHKGRVTALAFCPDGKRLISGGTINASQTFGKNNVVGTGVADVLLEWGLAKGTAQRLSGRGSSLAVSADGKTIAGAGMRLDIQRFGKGVSLDGFTAISLIEAKTGKELHQIKWRGQAVAFSPDGKILASAGGTNLHLEGYGVLGPNGVNARKTDERIHLWEAATAKQLLRLPQKDATAIAFSPDGKTIAAGDYKGSLTFWDIESEKRHPTPDPAEVVTAPPPGDALLAELHADFLALAKKDKNPAALLEANKLLNQTNRSDRWTYYLDALAILRKQRSKAGIPLLLRYMVEHTDRGDVWSYANTLSILTGEDRFDVRVGRRAEPPNIREHVRKLVETWWRPNKDRITTDFDRMSEAQREVVFGRVVNGAKRGMRDRDEDNPARRVAARLRSLEDDRGRREWYGEDLHASMLALFLAEAGYREKPEKKATREHLAIPFASIPLLAELRKRGDAPSLDKIAADELQSSATRLTCLLAMYRAGASLRSSAVLPILEAEKKLERRLVAIRLLGFCRDREAVRPKLLRLLDDPNVHVRTATLDALAAVGPAGSFPKLKKLLDEGDPREATDTILSLVVQVGTPEAKETLAGVLAKSLEGGKGSDRHLHSALSAFEQATGMNWTAGIKWFEEGTHPEAQYREAARKALKWWGEKKPRSSLEADLEEWLKGEKAGEVRRAARMFEASRVDQRSYREALQVLRRGRQKAAVPLLLTCIIKDNGPGTSRWQLGEYADTISVLTGKEMPDDLVREPKAIEKRVREWWSANKDTITTDPEKMSDAEVRVVVRKLLELGRSRRGRSGRGRISVEDIQWPLQEALDSYRHEPPTWWEEELHPVMVPELLAAAKAEAPGAAKAAGRGAERPEPFPFAAIGMLAALRRNGDAPDLARVARDARRPAPTRLLCLLALFRAGERLPFPALAPLLGKEEDLACRLIATLSLAYCQGRKECGEKLVELLDDPNEEVQIATVVSLQSHPAEKALTKLKAILENKKPERAVRAALTAVAAVGTREAKTALGRYLEKEIANPGKRSDIYHALWTFQDATGTNWIEAGAHDDDYYREKAKLALAWWKKK